MSPSSPREERLAQVEADLADLDQQVEQGELDADTADLLRSRYLEERQGLLVENEAESVSALSGRRLLGIGFILVAAVGLALWLIAADGSGALPAGTYRPTASSGCATRRQLTPGIVSTLISAGRCAS